MEALGRSFNVAPIAAGRGISLKGGTAVTFVCTGADTFTVTSAASFGGSYSSPGNVVDHYYQQAATNGSAAWTKQTQTASNAVVQASAYTTLITVSANSLPDTHCYVKCSAGGTGLVTAIVHDLSVQRKPANLPALSA